MFGTNPSGTKKFVVPSPEMVDAMLNEFNASALSSNPSNMLNEWRKRAGQGTVKGGPSPSVKASGSESHRSLTSSSASILSFDDSRSRSGFDGTPAVSATGSLVPLSEESNHPFLRSHVDQDSKFAASNGAYGDDEEIPEEAYESSGHNQTNLGIPRLPDRPEPVGLSESQKSVSFGQDIAETGSRQLSVFRAPNKPASSRSSDSSWVKKRFRYMVEGKSSSGHKHAVSQVMECAPEFNVQTYPTRVLIAKHIRRPKWGNKPFPPGLSLYTYEFYIYQSLRHILQDLKNLKNANDRTLFTIVEENGPVFLYFDIEIPVQHVDAKIHGISPLALFGYCIAMFKTVLSMVLQMNLACWADTYLIYDSSNTEKWSAHAHVPLPFRIIGSLREAISRVKDILTKMFESTRVPVLRPLFFLNKTKKGTFEWKSVIDMAVFTKKRNFRLPLNTKCDKNAFLKYANKQMPAWNRHPNSSCSVDPKNEDDLISAGMILARNSRAFWNNVTVKYAPLLGNRYGTDAKNSDFRCLPTTGLVNTVNNEVIRPLVKLEAWPPSTPTAPLDQKIASTFNTFFEGLYEENWHDMTRTVLNSELTKDAQARSLVQTLLELARSSPRRMGIAMILLQQLYRPGAGLDQQVAPGSFVLKVVCSLTEVLDKQLNEQRNPIAAFNTILAFYHNANKFYSKTCSNQQALLRDQFFKDLGKDFIDNYINKIVAKNAYVREHLFNVFVLNNVVRYLLLCSGYHVHTMQTPDKYGAPSLNTLPHTLFGYQRQDLDSMYDYVFKTAYTLEGKQDAPLVAMLNQRRKRKAGGLDQTVVPTHRLHYNEDLVKTIERIRVAHSEPESTEDDTETDRPNKRYATFSLVNAHNNREFPKLE